MLCQNKTTLCTSIFHEVSLGINSTPAATEMVGCLPNYLEILFMVTLPPVAMLQMLNREGYESLQRYVLPPTMYGYSLSVFSWWDLQALIPQSYSIFSSLSVKEYCIASTPLFCSCFNMLCLLLSGVRYNISAGVCDIYCCLLLDSVWTMCVCVNWSL